MRLGFATVALFNVGCAQTTITAHRWSPPKEGVVRDARAATMIARAVWLSVNPNLRNEIADEATWRSGMQATLKDHLWEVASPKLKPSDIGGRLFIYISQDDGRVVDMYVTQ